VASNREIFVDQTLGALERMNSLYYKTIRLGLIIACVLLFTVFAVVNSFRIFDNLSSNNIWFNDFFGLWSYSRFLVLKPILEIYNNDIILDFQMDLGGCPKCLLPYAYPPFFLFFISPLGFCPVITPFYFGP
jgi:hypothetical protein